MCGVPGSWCTAQQRKGKVTDETGKGWWLGDGTRVVEKFIRKETGLQYKKEGMTEGQ